uniref:Uncharacterized protein n=1 Tax=Glossina brevipalpis TaxID=37001 RepID=A0A1A9W780_9MUSC
MPLQPIRFFYDLLNQSSRALYIFLESSKIPFEAVSISVLKEYITIYDKIRDTLKRLYMSVLQFLRYIDDTFVDLKKHCILLKIADVFNKENCITTVTLTDNIEIFVNN